MEELGHIVGEPISNKSSNKGFSNIKVFAMIS